MCQTISCLWAATFLSLRNKQNHSVSYSPFSFLIDKITNNMYLVSIGEASMQILLTWNRPRLVCVQSLC